MTVSVTDQALFFAGALVMGAAVGLLYDAFRILRVRVRLPLLGGVLDLLFWLVVTVALFVYTTTAGSGEVRLYIVAAVLLGAAAYFWLLSRWFLKLGYRLADLVGVLWRVLTLPVVFLLRLCKKIGKTAKKSFHYRRKWYRIRLISREMDELHRSDRRAAGGGAFRSRGRPAVHGGGANRNTDPSAFFHAPGTGTLSGGDGLFAGKSRFRFFDYRGN